MAAAVDWSNIRYPGRIGLTSGGILSRWVAVVVYIIEDDAGVSDALHFLLQSIGYAVSPFDDAETFLALADPTPEDVVIVDLGLPGISGAEVIRALIARGNPPKVICISGQAQKAIDDSLRGIPAPHVLRKPLSGEKIVSLL